ncbi:hypothetical protein [Streptomyces sp. NPDC045251]|uniref:hypothetical protein n=1 Tax=unclassified Streptomyces TaxID=2593676 RepID=UPI0033DD8FF9
MITRIRRREQRNAGVQLRTQLVVLRSLRSVPDKELVGIAGERHATAQVGQQVEVEAGPTIPKILGAGFLALVSRLQPDGTETAQKGKSATQQDSQQLIHTRPLAVSGRPEPADDLAAFPHPRAVEDQN